MCSLFDVVAWIAVGDEEKLLRCKRASFQLANDGPACQHSGAAAAVRRTDSAALSIRNFM